MVADHLVDDEGEVFFGKLGVELGVFRQGTQPSDLVFLPGWVSRGKIMVSLQSSYTLRTTEALRQNMDHRRIDIVDALTKIVQFYLRALIFCHTASKLGLYRYRAWRFK
jgi:hypothetical protein